MPDDLIDLPLGEEEAEPTFPTDEAEAAVRRAVRRRGHRRSRRSVRMRPLWILVFGVVVAFVAWLYLRPSRLEVTPSDPAAVAAPIGQASDPIELFLANNGRRAMAIEDIRVAGDGFAIDRRTCGDTLQPGGACRVQVVFVPPVMGATSGTLEVAGSQRGGLSSVVLRGEGLGARLEAEPGQLSFENATIEGASPPLKLRLTNRGTLAGSPGRIAIDSREFRVTGNTCRGLLDPGGSCEVEVVFEPQRLGDRSASLTADGEVAVPLPPIALTGRGTGPGFEIRPTRLTFGERKVGTRSASQEVVWLNQSREPWRLVGPRIEGEAFRLLESDCERAIVAAGDSCRARIDFAPRSKGKAEGELVLVHGSGERFPPAELSGTGTAPQLELDLRRIGFPATPVGRSSPPRTLRLTNSGTAAAALGRVSVEGAGARSFRLQSECPSTLEVGGTCVLRLELSPRADGEVSAALRIESDAPESPLTLPLVGNGASPRLALSRSRLDFATVPQGESQELELALENPGSAPLEVNSVAVVGRGFVVAADGCSGQVVVAGGDCQVSMRFQPESPGAFVGRVMVSSSAGSAEVALSGLAGEAAVPTAAVDPDELVFDPTPSGSRSLVETITLTSRGPGRLTIDWIQLEGSGVEAFRLVPATCSSSVQLLAGSSCTIGVRFQPAADGTYRAEVIIRSDAAQGRLRIGLRGDTSP